MAYFYIQLIVSNLAYFLSPQFPVKTKFLEISQLFDKLEKFSDEQEPHLISGNDDDINDDDEDNGCTIRHTPIPLAPTVPLLVNNLPRFVRPALTDRCKKDCRMWLWKGDRGRLARAHMTFHLHKLQARYAEGKDEPYVFRYIISI